MSILVKQIRILIAKEVRLEWKHKFSFSGVMMYAISTIYICYLSFKHIIDPHTWNALFWIIMLFAATNAVAKSFMQENRGQQLFFYTLMNPRAVILSKIIYNLALLTIVSFLNYLIYSLLLGNEVQSQGLFLLAMLLGSFGLSATLTLVSAIVNRANNSAALMAVLGFPILIPLLITTIKCSMNAIDGLDWYVNQPYFIALAALDIMIITLSYLLFPYLWRD